MEKLKKRSTAAAITAAVIVVFTLLGVRLSVGKAAAKVEQMFYDGVPVGHYVEPGIQTHLKVREEAANGLLSMASGHEEASGAAENLRKAYKELTDAKTISQKAEADRKLDAAYRAYIDAMLTLRLDEREQKMLEAYSTRMENARREIGESFYNLKVDDFRRQLEWFPMGILTKIVFAPTPVYFE